MNDIRVLVIDDDHSVREVLARMLQCMGLVSVCCPTGELGLSVYAQALQDGRRFDAVIIDLAIPGGIGGKETLRRLQRMDSTVRAIVTSGYSDDPVLNHFADHGFCGQVTKPFQFEHLERSLSQALGLRVGRLGGRSDGGEERQEEAG